MTTFYVLTHYGLTVHKSKRGEFMRTLNPLATEVAVFDSPEDAIKYAKACGRQEEVIVEMITFKSQTEVK